MELYMTYGFADVQCIMQDRIHCRWLQRSLDLEYKKEHQFGDWGGGEGEVELGGGGGYI